MAIYDFRQDKLAEARAASASAGTAVGTTPVVIPFPAGSQYVSLRGRNYSTAVVVQWAVVPYLVVFKTTDNLATITDYTSAAQDGDTATDVVLSSLDTAANQDYLYVGAPLPFRGVIIDVDAPNGNASVLTVNYWNGSTWTDTSATDGTIATGATMGQDGTVTWTVPTAWTRSSLARIASPAPATTIAYLSAEMYWTRWQVSVALDSSTTLNSLMALSRSTAYAELPTGYEEELTVNQGFGGVCGVEARTDAGTANLIVNCGVRASGRFV